MNDNNCNDNNPDSCFGASDCADIGGEVSCAGDNCVCDAPGSYD
ncbi:MAG: hypothetical protein SFT91_02855 [Rickettsiaceae bacterium]|nr:hypothetical protein [Rickettsiaceae bacterium]